MEEMAFSMVGCIGVAAWLYGVGRRWSSLRYVNRDLTSAVVSWAVVIAKGSGGEGANIHCG